MKRLLVALWVASRLIDVGSLSANEPVVLFDGNSLDNWDVLNCEVEIQDGALLLKAGNGLVQTKEEYTDFILEYEWKALASAEYDSGIYFRYSSVPKGRPWPKRFQVNLRYDMMGELDGFMETKGKTQIKVGEWNRFELTVKGSTVALAVNGKPTWKVDGLGKDGGLLAIRRKFPRRTVSVPQYSHHGFSQ